MVSTRSSCAPRAKKVSYKEVDEDVDVSDSERVLLKDERAKGTLKENFGAWTVRLDLSQSWERDAEPLPMLARLKHATFGKNCMDQDDLLESVRKPRVRMGVRLGKLSGFMKMPVEIVMEIASYLEPLDLLHLARTNNQLRALFLSKRSITVWRIARETLKLVECPEDLSEPAFASLVFEKDCHVCGAPNIDKMTYETRITLCRSCRINFVSAKKILEEMEIDPVEYNPHIKTIGNMLPYFIFGHNPTLFKGSSSWMKSTVLKSLYFKPDFVEMVGRFFLLFRHGHRSRSAAFARNRRHTTAHIYEHSQRTGEWRLTFNFDKYKRKCDIGEKRKACILEKLRVLGHDEDEFPKQGESQHYNWEEFLTLPYEFKPKAWKTAYPKLQKLIAENKTGEEKKNVFRRRIQKRDYLKMLYDGFFSDEHPIATNLNLLAPTVADLLELPEFKKLVDDDSSESIDLLGWAELLPKLVGIIREHGLEIIKAANFSVRDAMKRAKDCDLITSIDMIPLLSSADASDECIERSMLCVRAFSLFKVKGLYLGYFVGFADLISAMRSRYRGRDDWLKEWNEILPWKGENLECSDMSMLVAIALMREMGLDWETVDISKLVGAEYGCARCATVDKRMTWDKLVAHYVDEYDGQKFWRDQMKEQAEKQIRSKPPYWTRFVNTHDVDDTARRLLHLPDTFEVGDVNPLGEELDAASAREVQTPLVGFPTFNTAACEVCWRMGGNTYKRYSPGMLKRHLRSHHGKEPEARDVHLPREL